MGHEKTTVSNVLSDLWMLPNLTHFYASNHLQWMQQAVPTNDFKFHANNTPKKKWSSFSDQELGGHSPMSPSVDIMHSRAWVGGRITRIDELSSFWSSTSKNSIDPSSLSWPQEVMWNSWAVVTMPGQGRTDSECTAAFGGDVTRCLPSAQSLCLTVTSYHRGASHRRVSALGWTKHLFLSLLPPAGGQLFHLMGFYSIWIQQTTAVKVNGDQYPRLARFRL